MQRSKALRSCLALYAQCYATSAPAASTSVSTAMTTLVGGTIATGSCVHAMLAVSSTARPSGLRSLHTLLPSLQAQQANLQMTSSPHVSQAGVERRITTTAHQRQQQQQQEQRDSLELTTEKIHALTDKIPQRPVTVVEGASYSVIILAAFGVLAFVVYQVIFNFILEPTALQCFNHTLNVLKGDPRVTVRLGAADDIRAFGSNSTSRVVRQQIPHQIYKDAHGTEHVRIQFYMKGSTGTGLVNADMYRDPAQGNQWTYTYLLVDVYANNSQTPSRLYVVRPQ